MIRRCALVLSVAVALPSLAHAQAADWTIDPAHSSAQFSVRHMVVASVRGHFDGPTGTATFDPKDLSSLRVDASIDAKTINTRNPARDADLRGPLFFDTAKFPKITFKSRRTEVVSPQHVKVTGELTMHGLTREVVLDVEELSPEVTDIWGNRRIGAVAKTTIDRRDFGLVYNRALEGGGAVIGDTVSITIDLELTRKTTKKEEE